MAQELNYYLKRAFEDVFDLEAKKLFRLIAEKYGTDYKFKTEDLLKFYETCQLKISYQESPKNAGKTHINTIPDDKHRCCARVWSHGFYEKNDQGESFGDRCQRKRIKGADYCNQHNKNLVHGRYDTKPDKTVSGFYIKVNDKGNFITPPQKN
jgi:hypothetical protein